MESAGYLINHTARLCFKGLHEQIAPLGLAPAQFMTLLELWREDGLTQKELVERLDVEQATMANTIARMERDGLIERRPHPDDRRARSIYATEKAKALEVDAIKAAMRVNEDMLAPLTVEEQKKFIQLMQRVIAGKKAAQDRKA
ncbi:MAG: MarR family transcriptional regulator [Alphaproteobacteria bacterium]|nr:MarR family transcriptional regulator [Alphaproteobacteria bacterium]